MNTFKYLKFSQPAGTFYMLSMPARFVSKIMDVKERNELGDGTQREDSKSRIKEITNYCDDPDATFPTPVILAIDSENITYNDDGTVTIADKEKIADVLDGQHRIKGLFLSKNIDKFELPVVFVEDATEEQKAYIFSIINSKQTRVSPSLIYDLFAVMKKRSPQKTCHEIARSLNKLEGSPFHNRLKMLGKGGGENASLSQGTFVKRLVTLITKNPDDYLIKIKNCDELPKEDLPFNDYFIENKDEVIFKVTLNLFSAVSKVFQNEWNNPDKSILSKGIGYGAIIKAFPTIYAKGKSVGDLSESYFESIFLKFKNILESENLELTSEYFSSNEVGVTKLSSYIIKSVD
ncbi:MAG: DGQHR domain-containing protein [Alteromonadaceae bacterium]|jgi:DGQHR domain-containing protein